MGRVKLADFGCSKQLAGLRTNSLDESLKALRGSVPWMAPEVIRQTGHSCEADMWSVGATVLEMVTAQHPWPEFKDTFSALFHIATSNSGPPVPESVSASLSDFFECCFKIIPKERSSASDLINHPFINTSSLLTDMSSSGKSSSSGNSSSSSSARRHGEMKVVVEE